MERLIWLVLNPLLACLVAALIVYAIVRIVG